MLVVDGLLKASLKLVVFLIKFDGAEMTLSLMLSQADVNEFCSYKQSTARISCGEQLVDAFWMQR